MTRRGLFAAVIGLFVATKTKPSGYTDLKGVRYTFMFAGLKEHPYPITHHDGLNWHVVGEAGDGRETVSFPVHNIVREQRDWLTGGWNAQSFEADFHV